MLLTLSFHSTPQKLMGFLLMVSALGIAMPADASEMDSQTCSEVTPCHGAQNAQIIRPQKDNIAPMNIQPSSGFESYMRNGLSQLQKSPLPLDDNRVTFELNDVGRLVCIFHDVILGEGEYRATCKVERRCETVFKAIGWKDDDVLHRSHQIFSLFAKIGKEERDSGKTKTSEEPCYHTLLKKHCQFVTVGQVNLHNLIPESVTGQIIEVYERLDKTTYESEKSVQTYPVKRVHKRMKHHPNYDYSTQVVKLYIEYMNGRVSVSDGFEIGRKYKHVFKFLRYEDDREKHITTKIRHILVDRILEAEDSSNILEDEEIVKEDKAKTEAHEKLYWISPLLPGYNYRIPHNKVEYR